MTSKERWLAALHCQPVDRLPYWPKLGAAYQKAQSAPFRATEIDALYDWIGCDKHAWIGKCLKERHTRTRLSVVADDSVQQKTYRTPYGDMHATLLFDECCQSWHTDEFPIKDHYDLPRMTSWFEDIMQEVDRGALMRAKAEYRGFGEEALVGVSVGQSPLMFFVEWLAGIETAQVLLIHYPQDVRELLDTMHRWLLRRTALLAEISPADVLYFVENTSTTMISPQQFHEYCFPHIQEYCRILHDAGRHMVLHMCGQIKELLPDLAQIPATAFEAFTAPPVGDTTLLEGRSACPQVCLIGGTSPTLWTRPAEEIIAQLEHDLCALPHQRGLAITTGGMAPPTCSLETMKAVGEWLANAPVPA